MPILSNSKHELFCREYCVSRNATKAALEIGYSSTSASAIGSKLLRNDKICARISELDSVRADKLDITEELFQQHLAAIAFQNIADYIDVTSHGDIMVEPHKASRIQQAAIMSIEVHEYLDGRGEDARDVRQTKIKLHPKLPALVKLGERMGWLADPEKSKDERSMRFAEAMAQLCNTSRPLPFATAAHQAHDDIEGDT